MERLMGDLKRMIGGLFVLMSVSALLGCSGGGGPVGFMPGTYVNSAGGKYAVADDTLRVEQLSEGRYAIYRRTGFNIRNGDGLGPRQYEREEWRAVWDPELGILLEQRWGKELRFDRACNCLEIGRRVYRKIDGVNVD